MESAPFLQFQVYCSDHDIPNSNPVFAHVEKETGVWELGDLLPGIYRFEEVILPIDLDFLLRCPAQSAIGLGRDAMPRYEVLVRSTSTTDGFNASVVWDVAPPGSYYSKLAEIAFVGEEE